MPPQTFMSFFQTDQFLFPPVATPFTLNLLHQCVGSEPESLEEGLKFLDKSTDGKHVSCTLRNPVWVIAPLLLDASKWRGTPWKCQEDASFAFLEPHEWACLFWSVRSIERVYQRVFKAFHSDGLEVWELGVWREERFCRARWSGTICMQMTHRLTSLSMRTGGLAI